MEPHTAVPEHPSELDGGGLDTAGHAGVILRDVPDDGVGGRRDHQPDAEPEEDEGGPQMDIGGVDLRA